MLVWHAYVAPSRLASSSRLDDRAPPQAGRTLEPSASPPVLRPSQRDSSLEDARESSPPERQRDQRLGQEEENEQRAPPQELDCPATLAGLSNLTDAVAPDRNVRILHAVVQEVLRDPKYSYPLEKLFLTKANHLDLRPKDSIKRTKFLPDEPPSLSQGTCALVGNSGGLLTASHGFAIDEHEYVIRINQGPTHPYEDYVGEASHMRVLNKKWVAVYSAKEDGGQDVMLPVEARNVTFVLTRASTWQLERLAAVMRRERPDIKVCMRCSPDLHRASDMSFCVAWATALNWRLWHSPCGRA
ncbi:hypothetical protein CYMTET_41179 [Cymbomonas tetramitiformis]|uniref:Uncharacterized protein n=1 Tax=Cymbomonas tetramitiformis TaxID=36881 RepID=A0AAE0C7P1_9CHLO|nr:hypothetical protein CYMTET_41179 [Cymbomonas tetramitiformis]